MRFIVLLSDRARADIRGFRESYEHERPGLGDRFARAVGKCIDLLEDFPFACSVIERGARAITITRFPYKMLYYVNGNMVLIVGLFHTSRDENAWRDLLD